MTVAIGLALIHLDVDEATSVMNADVWMRLAWKDDHLRWDPNEYGGMASVHFGDGELWKPDVLLYNR